jgi:dimethylhistidine N-methyltransferase
MDICRTVLEESSLELLRAYPKLEIVAIAAEYQEGLRHLRTDGEPPKLVLWLGSNIGNFERTAAAAFLAQVRGTMTPVDRLLVGIDLRKDRNILEAAYDDAQGVTAEFNRNLLARINRDLAGRFDLGKFRHHAYYDETAGRIEIYLISTCAQQVPIGRLGLEVPFAAEEAIHTENSYKYSLAEIDELAHAAGLTLQQRWLDADGRFSLNLFAAK